MFMLTHSPRLSIRQPSPTTIEYTVTTSPPSSLPLRLALAFVLVLRLIFGAFLLLLLHAKWRLSNLAKPLDTTYTLNTLPYSIDELFLHILSLFHNSNLGRKFTTTATSIPVLFLIPASIALIHILLKPLHTTETLLVLRGLGIQTSSSPTSYLTSLINLPSLLFPRHASSSSSTPGGETRFIPVEKVQDLFVNEVFMGWGVRYMLGVAVHGEEEIVVVFPTLLPGRRVVERVWRGGRRALWSSDDDKETSSQKHQSY